MKNHYTWFHIVNISDLSLKISVIRHATKHTNVKISWSWKSCATTIPRIFKCHCAIASAVGQNHKKAQRPGGIVRENKSQTLSIARRRIKGVARHGVARRAGIKNRAEREILFFIPQPSIRARARDTCGLLNSGRFKFISSAAKPLSMRAGLAVLGSGVVITSGQEEWDESGAEVLP